MATKRAAKINELRLNYLEILERMLLVVSATELNILKEAVGDPGFLKHFYMQLESELQARFKKGICLSDAEVTMRRLKVGG